MKIVVRHIMQKAEFVRINEFRLVMQSKYSVRYACSDSCSVCFTS